MVLAQLKIHLPKINLDTVLTLFPKIMFSKLTIDLNAKHRTRKVLKGNIAINLIF